MSRLRSDEQWSVMMTPMIDVVFLLMIFFVCTASFQIAEMILPSDLLAPAGAGRSKAADPEVLDFELIVVTMDWQNGSTLWQINGAAQENRSTLGETLATIAKIKSNLPVVIDPAGAVPLGEVIDVYDTARRVGFSKIQFAAEERM